MNAATWQQYEHEDQQQGQQCKHDAHGKIARQAQAHQAIGRRIEQVGEHCRDRERRQHRREEIQRRD